MNSDTLTGSEPLDWDGLLEHLSPLDVLILEQVYVTDSAPVALRVLQHRLAYLNVHERTIARHAWSLADRGLLTVVTSCEMIFNPVHLHAHNAEQLVRIWRLREQRSLGLHLQAADERPLGGTHMPEP